MTNSKDPSLDETSESTSRLVLAKILKDYKEDAVDYIRTSKAIEAHYKAEREEGERLARYDELEKTRWILQKHNTNNTLAGVYLALNHRSAELLSNKRGVE